jgi:hypothetical protein
MIFLIGLIGSLILIVGAAWPDRVIKKPTQSIKNWLFALGGVMMLIYSFLNYLDGGPIFFVILQLLVNLGSVFMMLNTPDRIDTPIMAGAGVLLIIWSLTLFEGYETLFFILGLSGIGMGYVMETGTFRRNLALALGSALIALFSYLGASWIFFWLNTFFALFSGYYAWKVRK